MTEPGLLCPEFVLSGDDLQRQLEDAIDVVGDNVGLFLKPVFCFNNEDIGIVALIGPCFTGDDLRTLDAVDMFLTNLLRSVYVYCNQTIWTLQFYIIIE